MRRSVRQTHLVRALGRKVHLAPDRFLLLRHGVHDLRTICARLPLFTGRFSNNLSDMCGVSMEHAVIRNVKRDLPPAVTISQRISLTAGIFSDRNGTDTAKRLRAVVVGPLST